MNLKLFLMFAILTKMGHTTPQNVAVMEDRNFWMNLGQQRLKNALNVKTNDKVAKNVIFFIGDGMSLPTVTAARILKGQQEGRTGEEGYLDFETFPYTGLVKTYSVDSQVADSASAATALLTGVKTNRGVVGVDQSVKYRNCSSLSDEGSLSGIASWFQDKGKRTGIVTTARITHATPSSAYAHSPSRSWECDAAVSQSDRDLCPDFKDIARQLVENEPGSNLNIIMAGGLSYLNGNAVGTPTDPVGRCIRKDGINLTSKWLNNTKQRSEHSYFVKTRSEMMALDLKNTENIMGIFSNDHMPFEYEKKQKGLNVPTLSEMVEAAITVLDKSKSKGYFLLVEGAGIDIAHHGNKAQIALTETVEFSNAIARAVNQTDSKDTLIVVTSDHSHSMTFSGTPLRGNDIKGIGGVDANGIAYTTLQYANGRGYKFFVEDGEVTRPDPRNENLTDIEYTYQVKDPARAGIHGGDDVPVYSTGPMSHLFQGVMEQNFIPHAIAYASCVGPNLDHCSKSNKHK